MEDYTAEQKKAEQKRKRFIANAWILLEKSGQAQAPSKDYCQLIVTTEGVVYRWWKISVRRSAVVYPGEWAVSREDVPDDDRLMMEIERTFGTDIMNQVLHLVTASNDFLSRLPQKILVKIAAHLTLEDVIAMAQTCQTFRRTCLTDSLWRSIYIQHHKTITKEIEQLATEHTWRKIFFTNKLKLQMLVSRQRSVQALQPKLGPSSGVDIVEELAKTMSISDKDSIAQNGANASEVTA